MPPDRHVHRPTRRRRVAMLCALVGVLLLGTAAPASAGNDAVDIQVQCIWPNPDGSTTAVWSYVNHTDSTVTIPVGVDNRITTAPEDRGQPTQFLPGEHLSAWVVTYTGSSFAWHLLSNGDTANNGSPRCPTNPVPLVGGWPAALLGLGVLVPGAWLVLRHRGLRALLGAPALPWRVRA